MLYLLLQKKKCKNCGKLSHKDVLFCWLCGHSFNLRICVSGHKNPSWVQHCRTCGKDRTLMSQPHTSKALWFVKHSTKSSTYVPGHRKAHHALAVGAVCLGAVILWYAALVIAERISGKSLFNGWPAEMTRPYVS
jgi:hypothetical protein